MSTRLGDKSGHFENHQCGHAPHFTKWLTSLFSLDLPVFLSSSHSLSQFVSVSSSWPWSPLSSPLSIISFHECLILFCLLVFGNFYPSVLRCWLYLWHMLLLSPHPLPQPLQMVYLTSALCLPGNRQTYGNERSRCGRAEAVWPGHPIHHPEGRDHR